MEQKAMVSGAEDETAYEAPAIESVLGPEEILREVHYAGEGSAPQK